MEQTSIFGELSIEQFLAEYWQKKPLLVRGAFADFEFPVGADELAGLACEEEVESRLILQDADGEQWQLEHGPFGEDRFTSLPERYWTLLVQAVDHWVPDAQALMEQFDFVPNWRLDDLMISYAADGGGVGPHYDNYDVFLIQAAGCRRWDVGGLYGEDSPRRPDTPVMILPEWQAEQSWQLQPGDMLYLPPRVGHNGVAAGDGCLTYSVGFRAPAHSEIFQGFSRFLADRLAGELRYADPDLRRPQHPGEIDDRAIERLQALMRQYIDQPDLLSRWFGEYMTEPKYPELATDQASINSPLRTGESLYRSEGARLAYRRQSDGGYLLFADGQSHSFNEAELPLVQQLADSGWLELNAAPSAAERKLLEALLRQGSIYSDLDQ
ncbi:cupin domain-containing protein [Marinobacterium arenosum]|uniref:cupin domain-containing protein n=1 Tax=Marinobacterium arenosum TaxID=2862496 RepID=UPI001C98067D|nr:cupin domain-containing protein [Marinobacterium arenosum]MBY4677874.1 cupin domain-containing protein [Marinobacterium arenosum]